MKFVKKKQIVLSVIKLMGPSLTSTDLMKYMFLFSINQAEPTFDFVPYRFGCFSFEAYHEINKLQEEGVIDINENYVSLKKDICIPDFDDIYDRHAMWLLTHSFRNIRGRELLKKIYVSHPYFAIKSTILSDVLNNPEQRKRVYEAVPRNNQEGFFSIGYEGVSLERYLNILIKNDVKILADVRKNPISRKYGFSRKTLSNALENIGIHYVSFTELGIEAQERQTLNTQSDYDVLFARYERDILSKQESALDALYKLYITGKRVAVTCFEKNPLQCHRTRILKRLAEIHDDLKGKVWALNES